MMLKYLVVLAGAATVLAASHGPNAAGFTLARCLEKDDAGGMLLHHSKTRNMDGDFVVCRYKKAGLCEYFTPVQWGVFVRREHLPRFHQAGRRAPPASGHGQQQRRTPQGPLHCPFNAVPLTLTLTGRGANLATCVPEDDDGGKLLGSDTVQDDGDLLVQCTYEKAGACAYFAAIGESSSGSSVCPDSITPPALPGSDGSDNDSSGADNSATGSAPGSTSSLATCPPTDGAGSPLTGSSAASNSADSTVACHYQAAGQCVYFASGAFSPGSSDCPDSIPASASGSGSAPAGIGSFLADDATTPPVLIALLVMNGLLVLGILTILFLWVRDRRAGAGAASNGSGRKGRYTPVNTNTARDEFSIPVASRGGYYDAQEKS
ncbi:hypothetical protein GGX14DRAFT_662678 [Mycena pura]|uniref:Uncharacterized protein n=1 Tax=Mycena pura TaxID=153505 RepID=A0AAD6VW58_9AGAR|nr:hypothetical protein GGX14DRAFT_662678 [Mycena pura]